MSRSVHVKLDDRTFVVDLDDEGEPLRVKERKQSGGQWYSASYWNAKQHNHGPFVDKIIARAKEKVAS